ncbi:hypothetical protein ACS0TY_006644 [Phlomoides rotata]
MGEAQIIAAREIGNLNSKEKTKLAENGAISPLILMLHSQDYESIEAALFALLNLAFGSERNKILIAKAGAVPGILKVLQWRNESLSGLALAALLILSSCSRNKPEIASSGGVQILLGILDSQISLCQRISHQEIFDILSTLHNLSTSPQIIPLIVVSGGVITVVRLIYQSDKSSELVEKAMALLETILSLSEVALTQGCETGGVIRMVVEAVEEGTVACREHAAGVLLMICKTCKERYRGMILREGAMAGLLQLSVDGTWLARKKAKALLLLLRDCNNGGVKHSKNVALEEVMREIDMGGTSLELVEEMIARLRT